jgi:hypothetical protein
MLFKVISMIIILHLNAYGESDFKIVKEKEGYILKNKNKKVELTYSGVPKIIKVSTDRSLTLVQYYSGSYGTSDIFKIENLIILQNDKVLIDAPFKYLNKKLQPKWNIDHGKKMIEVSDSLDRDRKVHFK